MRFQVYYDKFFSGKGSIFMYDTALVFEGSKPKFTIPFIEVASFIEVAYQLLLIKTTKTVPYLTILKYNKPKSIYDNYHKITYRLPTGKKCKIAFNVIRKKDNIYFSNKLEEYLTVVSSLSGN